MTLEPINLEDKTVTPTKEQIIVESDTADGLNSVIVEPIPDEYIKPIGTKEIVANGDYDVSQFANVQVAVGGITKGLIINACDTDGYVSDASIVGITEIPYRFMYNYFGANTIFNKIGANFHLDDNIERINAYAFYSGAGLKIKKMPTKCVYIGSYAFYGLGSTELVIPNATRISDQSFAMSSLTKVDLQTMDDCEISYQAFMSAYNLTTFIVRNPNPPTITTSTFQNGPIAKGTGYIYVPDNAIEIYRSATNWSEFADNIKGISELEG